MMHEPKVSADWATLAEAELREHGHKASAPRSAVLDSIGRQSCVVTAQDIADELKRRKQKVGIATVYRTLEVLEDLKLVQRLDLGSESARYSPRCPTAAITTTTSSVATVARRSRSKTPRLSARSRRSASAWLRAWTSTT